MIAGGYDSIYTELTEYKWWKKYLIGTLELGNLEVQHPVVYLKLMVVRPSFRLFLKKPSDGKLSQLWEFSKPAALEGREVTGVLPQSKHHSRGVSPLTITV